MTTENARNHIQSVISNTLGASTGAVDIERFITEDGRVDQTALDAWQRRIHAAATRPAKTRAEAGRAEALRRFGTTRTEQTGQQR